MDWKPLSFPMWEYCIGLCLQDSQSCLLSLSSQLVMEYGSAWPAQFLKMPCYSSGEHHQTQLIHAPTCHILNPIFKEWWNKVTYHTPNERRKYLKETHSQITEQMFFLNANLICTLKTVSALLVRWPGIQKQPLSPREGRAILRHKMEGTILLLLLSVEVISGWQI